MSQVTIYLKPELAAKAKKAAASEGLSQSRWVARLIKEKLANEWPESVKRLAGTWPADFPEAETLRENPAQDVPRENL